MQVCYGPYSVQIRTRKTTHLDILRAVISKALSILFPIKVTGYLRCFNIFYSDNCFTFFPSTVAQNRLAKQK